MESSTAGRLLRHAGVLATYAAITSAVYYGVQWLGGSQTLALIAATGVAGICLYALGGSLITEAPSAEDLEGDETENKGITQNQDP